MVCNRMVAEETCIVLLDPTRKGELPGDLVLHPSGYFKFQDAFGLYESRVTGENTRPLAVVRELQKIAGDFAFYDDDDEHAEDQLIHPCLLPPLLRRFGVPRSTYNANAIRYARECSKKVDESIVEFLEGREFPSKPCWTMIVDWRDGEPTARVPDVVNAPVLCKRIGNANAVAEFRAAFPKTKMPRLEMELLGRTKTCGTLPAWAAELFKWVRPKIDEKLASVYAPTALDKDKDKDNDMERPSASALVPKAHATAAKIVGELLNSEGKPLIYIDTTDGLVYIGASLMAQNTKASRAERNLGADDFKAYLSRKLDVPEDQLVRTGASPEAANVTNTKWYNVYLAIYLLAQSSPDFMFRMIDLFLRFHAGLVTTGDSMRACAAMSQSVKIVSDGQTLEMREVMQQLKLTQEFGDSVHDAYERADKRVKALTWDLDKSQAALESTKIQYRGWLRDAEERAAFFKKAWHEALDKCEVYEEELAALRAKRPIVQKRHTISVGVQCDAENDI